MLVTLAGLFSKPLNNPRCTGHQGRFRYKEFAIGVCLRKWLSPSSECLRPLDRGRRSPISSPEISLMPKIINVWGDSDACHLRLKVIYQRISSGFDEAMGELCPCFWAPFPPLLQVCSTRLGQFRYSIETQYSPESGLDLRKKFPVASFSGVYCK